MKLRTALVILLSLATTLVAADQREYEYQSFDVPKAIFTSAFGIGPNGDVVGQYRDGSNQTHGYVLSNGSFTDIDFPGAVLTEARGISPSGEIVGTYRFPGEPPVNLHGFLRTAGGDFERVDYPGHLNTMPQRIQPNGAILGCYHDHDLMSSMSGIIMSRWGNSQIDVEASMNTGATADGATIVGLYTDMQTGRGRGYVIVNGSFSPFDYPGATFTAAWDINVRGAIVGTYRDASGRFHGFLWEKGEFSSIDFPGARLTRAFGINARGDIVGHWVDGANLTHAFIATRRTQAERP